MFNRKTAIEKLANKSQKTLDIFTNTIKELSSHNSEVDEHIRSRDVEIKRLQDEQASLNTIREQNSAVINKINKLFE